MHVEAGSAGETDDSLRVKRIDIESSAWNGRKVVRQRLAIRPTKAGFASKGHSVDREAIRDLLVRLDSPGMPLTPYAMGINLPSTGRNAAEVFDACGDWPVKRDRLSRFMVTEQDIAYGLSRYYQDMFIVDADADLRLEVLKDDGSKVVLHSAQPHAYMLPWEITTPTKNFKTYDSRLSQAIVRLLPDGFLNREVIEGRPDGTDFICEIADGVYFRIGALP
jgi:hypothetical protein